MEDSCPLPPYFVHLCPFFLPKNLSLMKNEWSSQGCTHLLPIPSIHFSFSLPPFTLHNSLSPISFTSIQPIALFYTAEVSSSLSLSPPFQPSISLCPPSVHLLFSVLSQSPPFSALSFLFFFCLVPGPHPGYQLRPLQPYVLSSLPSFGSFF